MRLITTTLVIAATLGGSARAAVTVFDSNAFEGYSPGQVAGQMGWTDVRLDSGLPTAPANITASAPQGHGKPLSFDGLSKTESGAGVTFAGNLANEYKYVSVEFSFLRDGDGLANNLLWYGTGPSSTPWYGMAWDNGGAAPAQLLPAGFAAPGIQQSPGQWTSIRLDYNLADGLVDEYADGSALGRNVPVGTDPLFTGWAFVDQYDSATGTAGQRAYVDDFRVLVDNVPIVPEPGTISLLCWGVPVCLALRRRAR
jgi:hypothetical protein